MPLNFPASPTNGQTYTYGNVTYYYNSSNIAWITTYVAPSTVTISTVTTVENETANTSTFYPIITRTTTGNLITTNVTTTKLYFVPNTGTLSATTFASLSDITLKTDIGNINDEILIEGINPVSFKWKDTGIQSYGVIAQELEHTIPELVVTNEKGIKSVSYIPMISILINTVKRMQKEIDDLKMRFERLEK